VSAPYDYWLYYELRQKLLARDKHCLYCGKVLDKYCITIDHYIPTSKGGTDSLDNCLAACKDCNNEKSDLMPLNFILARLSKGKRFTTAVPEQA
jgi:5-methylcytosine-specific restriction endonuclease McrA